MWKNETIYEYLRICIEITTIQGIKSKTKSISCKISIYLLNDSLWIASTQ